MPVGWEWLTPVVDEGAWVLVSALGLATAFGAWRAARDGRFRGTHEVGGVTAGPVTQPQAGSVLHGVDVEHELGERATLLQFSTAFCAPCRVTRRVLAEVADVVPGVAHVEVDAEHHLDLVRRLGVTRTPTTLVLDADGREVSRASGAPRRDEVVAALSRALP
jgi:thiol-disulfide isomerase/thioredoxin